MMCSGFGCLQQVPARGDLCRRCESKSGKSPKARSGDSGKLQPCGTPAAYRRHKYNGEEPCDPCKAAFAEHGRKYAQKRRQKARQKQPA